MKLETFGTGQGYLKAGLLGFNKSGKTYTAVSLAIETRKLFHLSGPIACFDTEAGIEYMAERIKKETGQFPIGVKGRSLKEVLELGHECENGAASILIVDGLTHPWRELQAAYLDQVNKARDAMRKPRRQRLEFQDWANIKERWAPWPDFYLNSRLHIIICGRAGYDWDFEEVEDSTGTVRKELRKTGIKMKVESEFGFEPSLLVEMERVQVPVPNHDGHFTIMHRATVLGDRFDAMDGATCDNPTGAWFLPHLSRLVPGAVNAVDTELKTDMGVDESGEALMHRERRERTKLIEEIQGELVAAYPGQSAPEKRKKVEILDACFGTKSWTAVEGFPAGRLAEGLLAVRKWVAENPVQRKDD